MGLPSILAQIQHHMPSQDELSQLIGKEYSYWRGWGQKHKPILEEAKKAYHANQQLASQNRKSEQNTQRSPT